MKKKEERLYHAIMENMLLGTSYRPMPPTIPNPVHSPKEHTDYILEAENAGKLAAEEKNAQEIENLRQILRMLYKEQRKNDEEIKSLKKQPSMGVKKVNSWMPLSLMYPARRWTNCHPKYLTIILKKTKACTIGKNTSATLM